MPSCVLTLRSAASFIIAGAAFHVPRAVESQEDLVRYILSSFIPAAHPHLILLSTTTPMQWSIYLQALLWRSLNTFGTFMEKFIQPRPLSPRFTKIIRTTIGPTGSIPLVFYTPQAYHPDATRKYPILINYHGGGWTIGNATDDARWATAVAQQADTVVCSVDYRRAPEHPFPVAVQDAVDAILWVYEHAEEIGVDKDRLALSGFSSGGNLSLAAPIMLQDVLQDRGVTSNNTIIKAIVAFYPVTDVTRGERRPNKRPDLAIPSQMVRMFHAGYLYPPGGVDLSSPYLSPLCASDEILDRSMPENLFMWTCEYDGLADEGEQLADRLREGVGKRERRVEHKMVEGVKHGWDHYPDFQNGMDDKAKAMYADACGQLRSVFHP